MDACPEPEVLAAYIDGRLDQAERGALERHLAGCGDCRAIVAGSIEALGAMRSPATGARRSRASLGAGAVAVLAAAGAIVFAVRAQRASSYYLPEMAELVKTVGPARPLEARLSGGIAYGPVPSPTRGTQSGASLDIVAAAESVRSAAQHRRADPAADAADGVASVFLGDLTRAVESLSRAAATNDPRMQNDLSAILLARADATGDRTFAAGALRAADAAIASKHAPVEAYFNRALALERLARSDEALAAWLAYVSLDPASAWASEASTHVLRLGRAKG